MKKFMELGSVFAVGGAIYVLIEMLFRGHSHWTMYFVGGIAVLLLYIISAMHDSSFRKWLMGTAVILTVEFVSGIIINIQLGWAVWDYSAYRFNLYGQICLPFALYWFALCIPANAICTILRNKVFTLPEKTN